MKLVCSDTTDGRTRLSIQRTLPTESVRFPSDLIVDARLDSVPPDRLWVAAALCFGGALGGVWDEETPISLDVHMSIQAYIGRDYPFHVGAIADPGVYRTGVGLQFDDDTLVKGCSLGERCESANDREFTLEVRRLGEWSGRLFSLAKMIVSSNAYLHSEYAKARPSIGPYLAVAVLLADDLGVDRITVPVEVPELAAYSDVCASVGIQIVGESRRSSDSSKYLGSVIGEA